MTKSQNKNRTKDRNRRHQQHQGSDVQVPGKSVVCPKRRPAHGALSQRGWGRQGAEGHDGQRYHYKTDY
jgi:hypothetical protein